MDDVELLFGFLGKLVGLVVVGEPLHLGRVCTLALVDDGHDEIVEIWTGPTILNETVTF